MTAEKSLSTQALHLADGAGIRSTFSPQELIGTLLGDYWRLSGANLPSAAIVELIQDFGLSAAGVRAALARQTKREFLILRKQGRRTYYGLTERGLERILAGARRISSFGLEEPWSGMWCGVVFSISEEQREMRHQLRSRLKWLNFAPLYDGFWISPRSNAEEVTKILDKLGVETATVFMTAQEDLHSRGRAAVDAWDLDILRGRYDNFITDVDEVMEALNRGDLTPKAALVARASIIHEFHDFQASDPFLPASLMPNDWPRARAREKFIAAYDALGPLALARVRHVISRHDESLVELATYRTADQLTQDPIRV
jgi:phenylacetic acid degradation operon negative regulatory protein